MEKQFVVFYSPGSFCSEESTHPIGSWDVDKAVTLSRKIKERHGATPYGFRFITRSRGDGDLDSKISSRSPFYYLGGTVYTKEEIIERNLPEEDILRKNIEYQNIEKIIINTNSWKFTAAFDKDDILIEDYVV